ncbi:MAG: CDP-glycerol glycerophosphotransferase family protein, partial [Proteobacteria bacterium]|nr:CDP-glycerol glycerophosphotransferase family protein [Pseudomonadota bacterium]
KLLSSANLPVLLFPTDKEKLIAQAGTVVIDSISYRNRLFYPLIAKARQVQLWHGVGNKKIGFQLQGASCLEGRDQTLMEDHSDYDLIVSTSEFYTEEVFKKSMHAKEFVSLGYPRTDVFFQPLSKEALLGCDIEAYARVKKASKQGPVVLFVPTFRDNGVNPLTQNVLDLEKFITLLKLKNAHLLIKTHSRTPVSFQNIPDNVTVCDSATDVYPFLPLVDTMITDYSSIYTEYLLLDKPIIFFWSDFEKYMSCDRGFQFPFEAMCPGPKCLTAEDLYRAVDEALQGQDDWKDARQKMRDKSFSHINGGASERIADLLVNQNS